METDVDGICCNLFLYNIQPGIEIDYATGESREVMHSPAPDGAAGGNEDAVRTVPAEEPPPEPEPSSMVVTYVLNKNTGKFHYPTCESVADIKAKNRMDVDWPREKVIAEGYQPCGGCKP